MNTEHINAVAKALVKVRPSPYDQVKEYNMWDKTVRELSKTFDLLAPDFDPYKFDCDCYDAGKE